MDCLTILQIISLFLFVNYAVGLDSTRNMALSTVTCHKSEKATAIKEFPSDGILKCASECLSTQNCTSITLDIKCKLFNSKQHKDEEAFCKVNQKELSIFKENIFIQQGQTYVLTGDEPSPYKWYTAENIGGKFWRFYCTRKSKWWKPHTQKMCVGETCYLYPIMKKPNAAYKCSRAGDNSTCIYSFTEGASNKSILCVYKSTRKSIRRYTPRIISELTRNAQNKLKKYPVGECGPGQYPDQILVNVYTINKYVKNSSEKCEKN